MSQITELLGDIAKGDRNKESELLELVYRELHQLAAHLMRGERKDHTLQPTALVNEAYVRLVGSHTLTWENRAHFFNAAAQTMRRILVDHARSRKSAKRPASGQRVELQDHFAVADQEPEEIIAIDTALAKLAEMDPRQARIVELRFFAGLGVEEVAGLMGISEKTVKRDWAVARAWLEAELQA
jgi:RNA polymerase sigma factor (TIGR02999 family)